MVMTSTDATPATGLPFFPTRSHHHLSEEQVRFFDQHGYLILRKWIPAELLARLQAAGDDWIADGLAAGESDPDRDDYRFAARPQGQVMYRVDYLHNKRRSASLELLGSPQVLAVAESLCGPSFVPTYEAMVFKQAGDGEAIPWHQDAVHPRRHRIFNFDLYLDHSRVGAGALRVLPGTQVEPQDVCAVADLYGWNAPGMVQVEMEPGDVLLHDVMVVHGSERVAGKALRRTIYYEFRAAEEILEDGPWDRDWIDRRMRLVPVALACHRRQFPTADQFEWQVADRFRPSAAGDEEQELRVAHLVHMSGSYCSAGDAVSAKDVSDS
jgi:ectoine hydroxylase-related dioxygenase (phytanoyl-CoA dioxygenase family)